MAVIILALSACAAIAVTLWLFADVIDAHADEWERRVTELEKETGS